jgi:RHH-type proline utilization regulon transcriptional repressor/proline dehydrogenase/delta 1-pyrroline-5-carboxylate dehydrogenase
MKEENLQSQYITAASEILSHARNHPSSLEKRKEAAIELAANMLLEATRTISHKEKKTQAQLARMMSDPRGKAFTTSMTDQCFRSKKAARIADQMVYLLRLFGIPRYLAPFKRFQLSSFEIFGRFFAPLLIPFVTLTLRKETSAVILPGEIEALAKHMAKRRQEGVRINLNHLGEAILGEKEAKRRLDVYLHDLAQPNVEYISIKISTIFSQINLLAWEKTLETLAERLRLLYRVAMNHTFVRADGTATQKFVNLDMEEYRDLQLTKKLFKKVLSEPEFHTFSAGIVLQAYLPDAHDIQKELTEFAIQRIQNGGAPIKIRIVKGANLAMEQVEASLRDWQQAPYQHKADVDANYKRMVTYGCTPAHAAAVHLGIGSHNLFDIAYALLLREEQKLEKEISFEMLEGMADHIRRIVQQLAKDMLLYCPVSTKEDFQSAIAYLIRRLDENTGPDNFLRHTFGLKPGTEEWDVQSALFSQACDEMDTASHTPRRTQDRTVPSQPLPLNSHFENESDTDFSLPQNRLWAKEISQKWQHLQFDPIPLVINGKEISHSDPEGKGHSPSLPGQTAYTYSLANWNEIDAALQCAKTHETSWGKRSIREQCELIEAVAQKLRDKRADLLGVMMVDGGKTILEGDPEISEAIDFAEYYVRSRIKMDACKDISWTPKGTILVTPPWNFPTSIPAGGILAALVTGNCVIFKPAPEAVLTGWVLVNAFWEAGIPREALQFINCADDPEGSRLIADKRISAVILTGATATARLFMQLRPDLDLAAETGGKNSFIITGMADRDLAIKDLVQSAFGHSGQKCSAASLAILEAEVYEDPHFRQQLKDAVESLTVATVWDPSAKVVPLIRPAGEALLKGLTTLENGEEWLVKPKQDSLNPNLWSPGVKWGVKEGSFMHKTELFGPVLAVMRANNLSHAIALANGTVYGLTSGLHSLDEREHKIWRKHIQAGNLYINRSITGAIVRRQPFGGCKASSFGHGSKAGGPNYIAQFTHPKQVALPQEKHPVGPEVDGLNELIEKIRFNSEELGIWYASISNYSYWRKRFSIDHDPSKILGQDNILHYRPQTDLCLRIQAEDSPLDLMRILAAALICHISLEISWMKKEQPLPINDQWPHLLSSFRFVEENEEQFYARVKQGSFQHIRLASPPKADLQKAAAVSATYLASTPVLASGRFELLHYLREEAISIDYHRYGNLGVREGEMRKSIQ